MLQLVSSSVICVMMFAIFCLPVPAASSDLFGYIYDIKGTAEISDARKSKIVILQPQKHILFSVRNGDRIRVGKDGKLIIVSVKDGKGYELKPDTVASIEGMAIKTSRGSVTVKEGYRSPNPEKLYALGVVLRDSTPCVKAVSPITSTIITLEPELKWQLKCNGSDRVRVRIFDDTRILFSKEVAGNSLKVPSGVLAYGGEYHWDVIGLPQHNVSGGFFSIPTAEAVSEIQATLSRYESQNESLPERLSLIFYLFETQLIERAQIEIEKLKKEFPDNATIREIFE